MVLIRTNFSKKIGLGHYMRCLRIARKLKKRGVIFLIDQPNLEFESTEFKHIYLYKNSKFINEDKDLLKTLEIIKKNNINFVVKDDYRLSYRWEKKIKKNNIKLLVIDDFYKKKHFCDYYLNYKIFEKNELSYLKNNINKNCNLFIGPKYSILNQNLKINKNKNKKILKNITFYAGGGGDLKIFYNLVKKLCVNLTNHIKINLVVSLNKKNISKFLKLKKFNKNFNVVFKNNYEKVIRETDLYIGYQGNAIYENSYLKILSIFFSTTSNQINSLDSLKKLGHFFILNKGDIKKTQKLFILIKGIIKNFNLLKDETFSKINLVDSKGLLRVINNLNFNHK